MAEKVEAVDTFADKWVAHLDREHDTPPLTIADMNDVIEFLGPMWERWYLQVTDIGTSAELPETAGWSENLRLRRQLGPHELMYAEHLAKQWQSDAE